MGRDARAARAEPVAIVAPTVRRARTAVRALDGRWGRAKLVAKSLQALLASGPAGRVILCPEGRSLTADIAFLRRARERALWPAPDADLHAAIAGLRGEHLPLLSFSLPAPRTDDRKSALLMEGVITPARARAALASRTRHWIVESPLAVHLTARQLEALSGRGVRWFVLEPIRLVAVLAAPTLARARGKWRHLLPKRTKVLVLRRT